MLLIEHRVNTVEHLKRVPHSRGAEIDIRDYDGDLRLVHDPFSSGETLGDFLAHCDHATLILNVKCDGLEKRILEAVNARGLKDYFFLDVANPTLVALTRAGIRNVAVRYSEFEPIEFALAFAGKVDWVWVDCFTKLPLDSKSYEALKKRFKICIVSPELQGHPREMIQDFRKQLLDMPVDAVCTDFCEDWM
jgi:hypothetical protein